MLSKENACLDNCLVCQKRINPKGKMVFIYKNAFVECWVHAGACFENYKRLLTGPKAIKQGMILGMCGVCLTPVREGQRYVIYHMGKKKMNCRPEEDIFLTTYPSRKNKYFVGFTHKKCEDSLH